MRNEFASELYATREVDNDAAESHSYFVQVLKNVRAHLSKHFAKQPKTCSLRTKEQSDNQPTENNNIFHNMFSVLQVYNPPAEAEKAPTIAPTHQPETDGNIDYIVEELDDSFAVMFAFASLLDDLAVLRAEVQSLWADYQGGRRDLASVSVAINLSMRIAQEMEEEVAVLITKGGGARKISQSLISALVSFVGISFEQKRSNAYPYDLDAYPLGKVTFFNTLEIFRQWTLSIGGGGCDLPECMDMISNDPLLELWTQDMHALFNLLTDLTTMAKCFASRKGIVIDELIAGMRDLRQSRANEAPL